MFSPVSVCLLVGWFVSNITQKLCKFDEMFIKSVSFQPRADQNWWPKFKDGQTSYLKEKLKCRGPVGIILLLTALATDV